MIYWKHVVLSVAVISLQQILCVKAYNTGAGPFVCVNMFPAHYGSNPQTGQSPYIITVDNTTYGANDVIQVTLKKRQPADLPFRGFLLQARVVGNDAPVGSFGIIADSQNYSGCTPAGSAVTHTNKNDKDIMVFTWTAPAAPVGDIEFMVTFVQSFGTFWVKEKSAIINDTTVPMVITTPADPVPTSVVLPAISVTGCGSTKRCYRSPQDCMDPGCDVLVTWQDEGNSVKFEMMGKTDGWVAVGLSRDQTMGDDAVTECSVVPVGFLVRNSFNTGKSNAVLSGSAASEGLSDMRGGFVDGVVRCEFTKAKTTASDKIFSLSDSYYLLIARGKMDKNTKLKHLSAPIISPTKFTVNKAHGMLPLSEKFMLSILVVFAACLFRD